MKVIMRLYKQRDLDLICLYQTDGFSFQKNIKKVLKAYVHNEPLVIEIPNDICVNKIPRSTTFHINLSEKEDDEIIKWINSLQKGYRNSALKNVFRSYFSKPIVKPYLINSQVSINESIKKQNTNVEEIIKEVLDAPAPKEDNSVVLNEAKTVLKEKNTSDTPVNASIFDNDNNDNINDFDAFDEFESMMDNF